ncbi:hypothetical protein C8C87_0092 [Flavobacterium sp. 120]|nr:hypothetical protein C8C87_0092 [Flavobacterium sp. 120]
MLNYPNLFSMSSAEFSILCAILPFTKSIKVKKVNRVSIFDNFVLILNTYSYENYTTSF